MYKVFFSISVILLFVIFFFFKEDSKINIQKTNKKEIISTVVSEDTVVSEPTVVLEDTVVSEPIIERDEDFEDSNIKNIETYRDYLVNTIYRDIKELNDSSDISKNKLYLKEANLIYPFLLRLKMLNLSIYDMDKNSSEYFEAIDFQKQLSIIYEEILENTLVVDNVHDFMEYYNETISLFSENY